MSHRLESLKKSIRIVEDFPTKGISFKDITTVIHDAKQYASAIDLMAELIKNEEFDYFIGPEARGFIFGAPLAFKMGKGFIPARKKGKLPYETASHSYGLEYRNDEIFVHVDSIRKGDRVVIVDDLLATGGTARAVVEIVRRLGGEVVCFLSLIELDSLGGREKLGDVEARTLIHYDH